MDRKCQKFKFIDHKVYYIKNISEYFKTFDSIIYLLTQQQHRAIRIIKKSLLTCGFI